MGHPACWQDCSHPPCGVRSFQGEKGRGAGLECDTGPSADQCDIPRWLPMRTLAGEWASIPRVLPWFGGSAPRGAGRSPWLAAVPLSFCQGQVLRLRSHFGSGKPILRIGLSPLEPPDCISMTPGPWLRSQLSLRHKIFPGTSSDTGTHTSSDISSETISDTGTGTCSDNSSDPPSDTGATPKPNPRPTPVSTPVPTTDGLAFDYSGYYSCDDYGYYSCDDYYTGYYSA